MDEETVVFDEELHGGQIPALDASIALDRAQDRQTVRAAIEQLPAEFREAITLRELEGMSYKKLRTSPVFRSEPSCRVWHVRASSFNCS